MKVVIRLLVIGIFINFTYAPTMTEVVEQAQAVFTDSWINIQDKFIGDKDARLMSRT